jgi:hypothetical protein
VWILFYLIASFLDGAPSRDLVLPTLHYSVRDGSAPVPGSVDPERAPSLGIVFLDEDLGFQVTLFAEVDDRHGVTEGPELLRLDPEWWKVILVELVPFDSPSFPSAEQVSYTGADFSLISAHQKITGETVDLRAGDRAVVDFSVPMPRAGAYRVHVRLPAVVPNWPRSVQGGSNTLSVRAGNENSGIRRVYLHKRNENPSFEEFKRLQLELVQLEPDNWILWEDFGNRSLGNAKPQETLAYYDRAYEIFSRLPDATTTEQGRAQAAFLTLYRRLYPLMASRADAFRLKPVWDGGVKTFKVIDSRTGKLLGIVDPLQPALPLQSPD